MTFYSSEFQKKYLQIIGRENITLLFTLLKNQKSRKLISFLLLGDPLHYAWSIEALSRLTQMSKTDVSEIIKDMVKLKIVYRTMLLNTKIYKLFSDKIVIILNFLMNRIFFINDYFVNDTQLIGLYRNLSSMGVLNFLYIFSDYPYVLTNKTLYYKDAKEFLIKKNKEYPKINNLSYLIESGILTKDYSKDGLIHFNLKYGILYLSLSNTIKTISDFNVDIIDVHDFKLENEIIPRFYLPGIILK